MVISKIKQGLNASGHLLLAEGHLRKASEVLKKEEPSGARREARWAIVDAGNDIRRALKLLNEKLEGEK